MAELYKRWARWADAGWRLRAKIEHLRYRALIYGPSRAGYYRLELWNDGAHVHGHLGDWEPYMKSKDLKTLKAIGRIEAARRLP